MVYVRGCVPKSFFEWFDGWTGNDKEQAKMLAKCYFEQLSVAPPYELFGWLERQYGQGWRRWPRRSPRQGGSMDQDHRTNDWEVRHYGMGQQRQVRFRPR